ncbi:MAG: DUF934 domain-containing protein [Burkholderiales bacterium]
MDNVIRDHRAAADNWRLLEAGEAVPPGEAVIVPLATWQSQRDALKARTGRLGVWLEGEADPTAIAGDLSHFALIAIHFPKFTDGRGYSAARLLRERHGYAGELRAIGDVLRDELPELARCGFDSFALRAGENVEAALKSFEDLPEIYAASTHQPLPLFRRRTATGRPA